MALLKMKFFLTSILLGLISIKTHGQTKLNLKMPRGYSVAKITNLTNNSHSILIVAKAKSDTFDHLFVWKKGKVKKIKNIRNLKCCFIKGEGDYFYIYPDEKNENSPYFRKLIILSNLVEKVAIPTGWNITDLNFVVSNKRRFLLLDSTNGSRSLFELKGTYFSKIELENRWRIGKGNLGTFNDDVVFIQNDIESKWITYNTKDSNFIIYNKKYDEDYLDYKLILQILPFNFSGFSYLLFENRNEHDICFYYTNLNGSKFGYKPILDSIIFDSSMENYNQITNDNNCYFTFKNISGSKNLYRFNGKNLIKFNLNFESKMMENCKIIYFETYLYFLIKSETGNSLYIYPLNLLE